MLAWLGLGQGYIRLVKLFAQPSDPTPTPLYNKLYTHYIALPREVNFKKSVHVGRFAYYLSLDPNPNPNVNQNRTVLPVVVRFY